MKVSAIRYQNSDLSFELYAQGDYERIDFKDKHPCPQLGNGFSYFLSKETGGSKKEHGSILIESNTDSLKALRLWETIPYVIRVASKNSSLPHFTNDFNKGLNISIDRDIVAFQFINFLGFSSAIWKKPNFVLPFEIIPKKIDYEKDYIQLTDQLAKHCAQLLLDYSSPTYTPYSSSHSDKNTLLEQFIFLRQFCYSENIRSLFESIKRNPDRKLVKDEKMKPFGQGIPSSKVFTHPFNYGKGWQKKQGSDIFYYIPQEMSVTHKVDSLDTPANRFIRFALNRFLDITSELLQRLNQNGNSDQVQCYVEAKAIRDAIISILSDPFFAEIGPMLTLPKNNQVLQKREGYAQILRAYIMLDMALQLDWHGKDAPYKGGSKNVALLYEYWLYFELFDILRNFVGAKTIATKNNPFISQDNGRLLISLVQGKPSCQSFLLTREKTRIDFYYNRTFSPREFCGTPYQGSYSLPFRPDYTLAIFPDSYSCEEDAIKDGNVRYLHFDAKYRINFLSDLGIDDTAISSKNQEQIFSEEKQQEITNVYKRGDILKMHTYNDAIRRTIGSYILYPGEQRQSKKFSLYDEIIPGVGAFAIRPSSQKDSAAAIDSFLRDVLNHNSWSSSRQNRIQVFSQPVLQGPTFGHPRKENDVNSAMILGYIRPSYLKKLKENSTLKIGNKFCFYFYAIRGSYVYAYHPDLMKTSYFRFYSNDISKTNDYELSPYLCRVEKQELISAAELAKRLGERDTESHTADFYYSLTIKITSMVRPLSLSIQQVNEINKNGNFSLHSPKVVPFQK